jgi:Fur family ferric uptake transcriptional regulator
MARPAPAVYTSWAAGVAGGGNVTSSNEIAGLLRQKGQRPTPQRMMILSVLAEHGGHLPAEAIYEQVRRQYPSINLSTIYRTLEMLRDQGIVSETDLGGGVRQFELLDRPHHHLICLHCGQMADLDAATLAPLRERLLADYGFHARLDHLAIFGVCRACAGADSREEGAGEAGPPD